MSIASEISRISQNVTDSLTAVAAKGVTVPTGSNSDDLPELIMAIPTGSGSAITVTDETDEHGGIIRHINAVSLAGITVTPAHLEQGYTAVNALGETIEGTLDPSGGGGGGNYQAKTNINPTTSSQTIRPDNGYDALSSVQINAMPSMTLPTSAASSATTGYSSKATISRSSGDQYINIPTGYNAAGAYYKISGTPNMTLPTSATSSATSGYTSKATISRSTSDQYINIPTGYNTAGAYYKIDAVQNGTEGTPTATKGTVSNHSVTVTPSVTNTEGYISGSTKTGTAVTVSASELVSGTKTITENGTGIDVTNYATIDVNVSGGSGTPAISIVDTTDSHGGTVRTITALNISDTTATAADVAQGKYFYTADGTKTTGTASGGGGSDFPVFTYLHTTEPPVASCNKTYAECVSLIESEGVQNTCPCIWEDTEVMAYCVMRYFEEDEAIEIDISGDLCVYDSEGNIFWA